MRAVNLMQHRNIVIVGAGLGGLLCGALLAKEGYQVTVLEKNKQIGGSLQSFGIEGQLFESAVHYIGSLQKGQTLYKIFNYLDIVDKISLKKLDEQCFDKIIINHKTYSMAQGYENFIETLAIEFPHQQENLAKYIREIKTVCSHFPLYNMRVGSVTEKMKVAHFGLKEKIDELISDELLKQILTGNNLLYASHYETTPFYIHALIENSYIESSWKCTKGSIQIAKSLQEIIQLHGGQVLRNQEVIQIQETNGVIASVTTSQQQQFKADVLISNLHPGLTYSLLDTKVIKPITRKRILSTPNTASALMVNITLQPKKILYQNNNIYYHKKPDVWLDLDANNQETPNSYAIFFYQDTQDQTYARGLSILVYMSAERFSAWQHTQRTTSNKATRGDDYVLLKNEIGKAIIQEVETILMGLTDAVSEMDVCTPLSYRDYLNIPNGSMYGLQKNVNDLANTTYATRTKIPNLFLTGQNINMHGILGVSITALLTVSEITGLDYLVEKINAKNA
jgi:all-trans-retinol 13,14-reductase